MNMTSVRSKFRTSMVADREKTLDDEGILRDVYNRAKTDYLALLIKRHS